MKLFCNATSPFARKVRVAMHEMGLSDRVEEVLTDPFAASPPPELLAANPLSRIPTLITDEGLALPDSKLILEWLQATQSNRLPVESARWAAARRATIAEGVIEAAVASVLEKRRPESIIMPAALDRQADACRTSTGVNAHRRSSSGSMPSPPDPRCWRPNRPPPSKPPGTPPCPT